MGICSLWTVYPFNIDMKNLIIFGTNQKGQRCMFPVFDNELSSSLNSIKIIDKDVVFPIKYDDMCYYNPQCSMSVGLILDDIIMNLLV